ncbi:MAG TPA: DUF4256 domain-containing protein [Candidatus Izemoplasmatales bacterium]|nr:DUF4256 domain-containing protein [Bacillota bacterium]HRY77766.1 DUF4256 domain-containing protein [Candidatus Izemoplasmatales bacterium]
MIDGAMADSLWSTWEHRFHHHPRRHSGVSWDEARRILTDDPSLISVLIRMESSGGEPDLIVFEGLWFWVDLSPESPPGRRGLCYDGAARLARKKMPPLSSAEEMAKDIGVGLMDERLYAFLQSLEPLDTKTSSWLWTPPEIRNLGGALFGDRRFGRTFVFHNGADSYYADRGFRGMIRPRL